MNHTARPTGNDAELTRRHFLGLGAASVAGIAAARGAAGAELLPVLAEATAKLEYLTPVDRFRFYGRGNPPPHKLPPEKRRAVGLDRETWQLEVTADPESDSQIERPLTKQLGTALNWDALMKLAEKHAVRFLKLMTCTNGREPCGMGLWEGVPLREILWLARPKANVRRVFYWGYHNDDPKQRFQSSLPIGRVLEDPPGELPVILCYKLNGDWLSPQAGAPVRMIVPEAYGNKSVKWIQNIVLTNSFQANDTYALWNNDVESPMKTAAHFVRLPSRVKASQPIPITGVAQVGVSGLAKVQYWLRPENQPAAPDDPYFTRGNWKDAVILPPPERWGGGLPDDRLPAMPAQFDPATGQPRSWPLRYTLAHWAALAPGVSAGRYRICCRTIDANGIAQPMPRPFLKAGNNALHDKPLLVEA